MLLFEFDDELDSSGKPYEIQLADKIDPSWYGAWITPDFKVIPVPGYQTHYEIIEQYLSERYKNPKMDWLFGAVNDTGTYIELFKAGYARIVLPADFQSAAVHTDTLDRIRQIYRRYLRKLMPSIKSIGLDWKNNSRAFLINDPNASNNEKAFKQLMGGITNESLLELILEYKEDNMLIPEGNYGAWLLPSGKVLSVKDEYGHSRAVGDYLQNNNMGLTVSPMTLAASYDWVRLVFQRKRLYIEGNKAALPKAWRPISKIANDFDHVIVDAGGGPNEFFMADPKERRDLSLFMQNK